MRRALALSLLLLGVLPCRTLTAQEPLAGTAPLTLEGDIASQLVEGVDRFLLDKLEASVAAREQHWQRDLASREAFDRSIAANRKRLEHILGLRESRAPSAPFELVASTAASAEVGKADRYHILAVRWRAFADVWGEGLLLVPQGPILANAVAIPDADQTPEQLCGLAPGVAGESQFARRLAESGCRVLVPSLISRQMEKRNNRANLSHREYLYRSAFELGRHLIGYELQKVFAGIDRLADEPESAAELPLGVAGYGEGGMLALYAGALDPRIDSVLVSGYFRSRQTIWNQPIDRNVFGLLEQFGDAELGAMYAFRRLVIEAAKGPELQLPGDGGGAPAELTSPELEEVQAEVRRAQQLLGEQARALTLSGKGTGAAGQPEALTAFLQGLSPKLALAPDAGPPEALAMVDSEERLRRQLHELDRHSQAVLHESPYVRAEFMKKLDTSSLEAYQKTVEPYRQLFREEVIGAWSDPLLPPRPRSRQTYDQEKWIGYEVVLDVFPDVIAYGLLLLPKDLKPGEKRPVVVCQHGLEGRPQDIVTGDHPAYHDFAARLCERGFITFAPQNLYIFRDRFRTLQRKANPLKKSLFSVIVPQHQQIVNWLSSLPEVDPERIAFYGLSYGGKSAMRIPPLVSGYCLSICSADFNEWVGKNASTRSPYSYVWTGEYEIFEFDLGSTFNYAEMAALICPRPFMVERGHFDGVGSDEDVSYEFAKVRFLYSARLKQPELCEIEYFDGPHTIHGKGTFDFLHRHLRWPPPPGPPETSSR